MAWQNNLREIHIILYRLKRNFGLPAILRRPLTNVNNIVTGQVTRTFQDYSLKRVIMLPTDAARKFIYDLSYIAASKNFTYGGYFDKKERWAIIDIKDMPKNFELTCNDMLIFENRQYELKSFELAEHNQGWILKIIEIDSSDAIS